MSNDESSDDELPVDAPDEGDETQADDSGSSQPDDAPAEAVPAERAEHARSKIGLIMFASAGALWGLFGMMRCDAREDGQPPSAAVTEDESPELPSVRDEDHVEPEPSLPDEAPEPQPAAETPEIRDADPGDTRTPETGAAGGFDPRPQAAAWARKIAPPDTVEYTVRRGGTLENVANLYKIFHHEITDLNPGVQLKQDLPPKTAVVVYDGSDESSQSIGTPSSGALQGGVPMVDGPGRVMKMIGWKSFGTANTVAVLDRVLRHWAETGHDQPVLVGNMSSRKGGRLAPHSTHQSGRDVDLGYMQVLPSGEELNWRLMNERNLDAKDTWALMSMLVQTGQVEVIYVDREIQQLLHEHAVKNGLMSKTALQRWMEYPAPTGSGSPVMQHVRGHADHMHVRFACQPHEKQCKSRQR